MSRMLQSTLFAAAALAAPVSAGAGTSGFTDLYNFCSQANCTDGENGFSGLVADRHGDLYGTTPNGGANGAGVVYKIVPGGTQTVLYSFCSQGGSSCTDGQSPQGGTLVLDSKGNLYGTTENGGANGAGTVFKLAPNGSETVLYSFCAQAGCTDGGYPEGGLARDAQGNIYGATDFYGANGNGGTLFEISASGTYSVLYSFCAQANCADGSVPAFNGSPLLDSSGNLFGTTYTGGTGSGNGGTNNGGVLWELAANGTYSVLYNFCSFVSSGTCMDSQTPIGTVAEDKSGNLYGTAYYGGVVGGCGTPGCGTVWQFTPPHEYVALHTFCRTGSCTDGAHPSAGVIISGAWAIGTAQCGGATGCGDVFSVKTGSLNGRFKVLHSFGASEDDNACCVDSPVIKFRGQLYGTTYSGGANNDGIVFSLGTNGGKKQ